MKIHRDTILAGFVAGYLFLFPYYLFASGLPQISDFLIVISAVFVSGHVIRSIRRESYVITALGLFIFWTMLVNGSYDAFSRYQGFIKYSIFYVFNAWIFLVTYAALTSRGRNDSSILLQKTVIWTLFLQLLFAVVLPNEGLRETGTFNNPNQLGYFALTAVAVVIALNNERKLNNRVLIALAPATILIAMTLSKAAIASFVAMLAVLALRSVTRVRTVVLFTAFIAALVVGVQSIGLDEMVVQRFHRIDLQGDDTAGGRGYDRLWLNPQYHVVGAGEGAYNVGRFESELDNEMHSTFGNLLFSYGAVGAALFLGFQAPILMRSTFLLNAIFFAGPVLYGLTHNGIRSGMLWVLLAAMLAAKRYRNQTPARQPGETGAYDVAGRPRNVKRLVAGRSDTEPKDFGSS